MKPSKIVKSLIGEETGEPQPKKQLTLELSHGTAKWLWTQLSIAADGPEHNPEAEAVMQTLETAMDKAFPDAVPSA